MQGCKAAGSKHPAKRSTHPSRRCASKPNVSVTKCAPSPAEIGRHPHTWELDHTWHNCTTIISAVYTGFTEQAQRMAVHMLQSLEAAVLGHIKSPQLQRHIYYRTHFLISLCWAAHLHQLWAAIIWAGRLQMLCAMLHEVLQLAVATTSKHGLPVPPLTRCASVLASGANHINAS